jgi:hypothetical protein
MRKRFLASLAALTMILGGSLAISSPVSAAPKPVPSAVEKSLGEQKAPKKNREDKKPKGVVADKGKPNLMDKAATQKAEANLLAVNYFYAGAFDNTPAAGTKGASVNMVSGNPYFSSAAAPGHSLGELAVQSADLSQIVEVGWTVDNSVCGAGNSPCLFVYHWVNDTPSCYNGCGWVDNAANPMNAGNTVGYPVSYTAQIRNVSGDWWIWWDGDWLGYFPGSLWTGATPSVTFDTVGTVQAFGELADSSGTLTPCSDMGYNGELGTASNTNAARMGSYNTHDGTAWSLDNFAGLNNSSPNGSNPSGTYEVAYTTGSTSTIRYGGPGWNSVGEAPGAKGSCAPNAEGVPAASSLQVWKEACPDGAAVTGCNSAWSVPWAGQVINQCHVVSAPNDKWRRVWNNSLSSGKAFYVYASSSCGSTRQLVTNASKLVTPWDIHSWARAS